MLLSMIKQLQNSKISTLADLYCKLYLTVYLQLHGLSTVVTEQSRATISANNKCEMPLYSLKSKGGQRESQGERL